MDSVLTAIDCRYLLPAPGEQARRKNLQFLLESLLRNMCYHDDLFRELYVGVQKDYYGDDDFNTKRVASYKIRFLLDVPKAIKTKLVTEADRPALARAYVSDVTGGVRNRPAGVERLLDRYGYLDTRTTRRWLVNVASATIRKEWRKHHNNRYLVEHHLGDFYVEICEADARLAVRPTKFARGGLAPFDVHIEPCIYFGKSDWPPALRSNPLGREPNFFVTPKAAKRVKNTDQYWSPCFQLQERRLFNECPPFRTVVKLFKKMRRYINHARVPESCFTNLVLTGLYDVHDGVRNPPSVQPLFFTVLKAYLRCLEDGRVPYFWNHRVNLMPDIGREVLSKMVERVKNIIADLESHPADAFLVAKYIISPAKLSALERDLFN
ncbi:cyclic GMP-AMP synthase-like receptor isoform X2 [Cylas formicarius]|uniref:cyclic GMP-AMP synthase-like receptor isoform X2 n=1 Tax=Cylas formicarius TaxID=197179 RepID=UPI002958BB7D|nr:cyclic GMP-AMP synthase-like receptor isoform X2 [Cylas formicarius]XP_060534966.1 cyclic GMP-AMP synthase-like receptor isoform X2 [Cylas formicarius]